MPGMSKDPAKKARQLANLRPCKPGQILNPNGPRPRGSSITSLLITEGDKLLASGERKKDRLSKKIWTLALAGNVPMMQELLNRHDGKVKDKMQLELKGLLAHLSPAQLAERLAQDQAADDAPKEPPKNVQAE